MKRLLLAILLFPTLPGAAQTDTATALRTIVCDESKGCTHRYTDGELFMTITDEDGTVVTAGLIESKDNRYFRLNVGILNGTSATFDVMPGDFVIQTIGHKPKALHPIPPEKITKAAERSAWWANYLNRVGSNLATQKSTTRTESSGSSSGTVSAQSSDGSYTTGTYHGTSTGNTTSTTTSPDYEARARADEKIRQRNAAVSAMNEQMMNTALKTNTLSPGQSIAGFVYFKSEDATALHPQIAVGTKIYEFVF